MSLFKQGLQITLKYENMLPQVKVYSIRMSVFSMTKQRQSWTEGTGCTFNLASL